MSEQLNVCKALAAMIRSHGEPDPNEVTFVANAAMELGLSPEESTEVQTILKDGGEYSGYLPAISSRVMRTYLFRRVVAATLIDEKIEDKEMEMIHKTADAFSFQKEIVGQYMNWMKEGIDWEKKGAEIVQKL